MVVMEETTGVESPSVHVLPSSLKNATAISPPYNFPTSFTLPYSAFLSHLSLEMDLSILLTQVLCILTSRVLGVQVHASTLTSPFMPCIEEPKANF